jgi:hypothetical protein
MCLNRAPKASSASTTQPGFLSTVIVLAIGASISAAVLPAVVASSSRVPALDPLRGALKLVEVRADTSAAPLNKPNLI